jgi:enoyl-CoA hydratase/carnithine racemase
VRVHGSCFGAGVELPAFAGEVIAHPDTTFRLPEVGMGLIPGAGVLTRWLANQLILATTPRRSAASAVSVAGGAVTHPLFT